MDMMKFYPARAGPSRQNLRRDWGNGTQSRRPSPAGCLTAGLESLPGSDSPSARHPAGDSAVQKM